MSELRPSQKRYAASRRDVAKIDKPWPWYWRVVGWLTLLAVLTGMAYLFNEWRAWMEAAQ